MTQLTRVPYDSEIELSLPKINQALPAVIKPSDILKLRSFEYKTSFLKHASHRNIVHRDITIAGFNGAEIIISIFQNPGRLIVGPGIVYLHGGGMFSGDRFMGVLHFFGDEIEHHGSVVISVEYRLAPEHPDPIPLEDSYCALLWVHNHLAELNIDPKRLLISGMSSGAGLAAGVTLLARDRQGPKLCGQMLISPMLDDRDATFSTLQYEDTGTCSRITNKTGWDALLGKRRGSDQVSQYSAPARAESLSDLPNTYIDCGSAEIFRDECVTYASSIWKAGGQAELLVWAGGFHVFDLLVPRAEISQAAIMARNSWLKRVLHS